MCLCVYTTVLLVHGSSTVSAKLPTCSPNQYLNGCDLLIICDFMPIEGMIVLFMLFIRIQIFFFLLLVLSAAQISKVLKLFTPNYISIIWSFHTSFPFNSTSFVMADPLKHSNHLCWHLKSAEASRWSLLIMRSWHMSLQPSGLLVVTKNPQKDLTSDLDLGPKLNPVLCHHWCIMSYQCFLICCSSCF